MKHLRVDFGTKHNRGVRPEHFVAEGAAYIKAALKTLDAIGWSKLNANGKGRIITEEVSILFILFRIILRCFLR